jgi:hypothetical protein
LKYWNDIYIYIVAVFNGCEAWPLTLREEHTLRVSENRVLCRYLGLTEKEGCKRCHNEELDDA